MSRNPKGAYLTAALFEKSVVETFRDEFEDTIACPLHFVSLCCAFFLIPFFSLALSVLEQCLLIAMCVMERRINEKMTQYTFEDVYAIYQEKFTGLSADQVIRIYYSPKVTPLVITPIARDIMLIMWFSE